MEISNAAQNGIRRIIWVDVLKCLAMFLVLWGHCIQHFTNLDFCNNPVFLFIYSFHMPLFMMLSGYFASNLLKRSYLNVFTSKFLQLLLPTLIFGIVYWLQSRFLLHQTHRNITFIWYYYWFLKSLFVCIMLFYIGVKICKKKWIGLTTMIVISQFVDIIPYLIFLQLRYMFPCFVLGYVLCHFKDYFYRYTRIILPVSLAFWCLMLIGFNQDLLYPDIKNFTNLGEGFKIIYSIYYKLLIGMFGGMSVMGIIYLLCVKLNSNKILDKLAEYGRYTLAIYIIQSFVVESWLKAIISYPVMPYSWLFSLVYAPIISAIAMAICLMICFWLEKAKLNWLFDYNHLNNRS